MPMATIWSTTVESTPSTLRRAFSSTSSELLNSFGVRMSMSQPVSLAARRTFCPRLPIASESWPSTTTTVARPSSKHSAISATSAGLSELDISILEESFQRTMSIFSPPSSSTMLLIRLPLTPTHAPTASTFVSRLSTATLVR